MPAQLHHTHTHVCEQQTWAKNTTNVVELQRRARRLDSQLAVRIISVKPAGQDGLDTTRLLSSTICLNTMPPERSRSPAGIRRGSAIATSGCAAARVRAVQQY